MPDLYRRKVSGKTVWYAKLWEGGRLVTRSTGTASKRLAVERAKAMQCALSLLPIVRPETPNKAGNTLGPDVAWKAYHAWAIQHKAPKTIAGEAQYWRQFWEWQGGDNLYRVERAHVEAWKRQLVDTPGPQGRARSLHSVNDALRHMAAVMNRLVKQGVYAGENRFTSQNVERLKAPRRRPEALNKAQIVAVFRMAERRGRSIHLVFGIGIYAGLRKGEILALQWRDIDFERRDEEGNEVGCITVWESTDGWRPKTDCSQRVVPLHPALRAILGHYRPLHGHATDYVIKPAVTSQRVQRKGYRWEFQKTFKNVIEDARLSDPEYNNPINCTPHTLRRTFASQLIAAGVSPHLVKDWMGHKSILTTERSYIASRPVSLEIGRF